MDKMTKSLENNSKKTMGVFLNFPERHEHLKWEFLVSNIDIPEDKYKIL